MNHRWEYYGTFYDLIVDNEAVCSLRSEDDPFYINLYYSINGILTDICDMPDSLPECLDLVEEAFDVA